MFKNHVGENCYTEEDLLDHLMITGTPDITNVTTEAKLASELFDLLDSLPTFVEPTPPHVTVDDYDRINQDNWFMPAEYRDVDIAAHILGLCKTESELQRVGEELLLYQEYELFDLLRYLRYLVDVMRENNIIWGVGRGSSVASYVLYLIGVHRINSMFYDLSIDEFLR